MAIKKIEIMLFAAIWMVDLEMIILSEAVKDKYYMISLICKKKIFFFKIQMNSSTKQKQIHRLRD